MDFSESLKKIFLAGVGAVATTAEASKDLIDTFVKKGEITVEQGKALNEELKNNAKEKLAQQKEKKYQDILDSVDTMSEEHLEQLKEKLHASAAKKAEEAKAAEEKAAEAKVAEAKAAEAAKVAEAKAAEAKVAEAKVAEAEKAAEAKVAEAESYEEKTKEVSGEASDDDEFDK